MSVQNIVLYYCQRENYSLWLLCGIHEQGVYFLL